jgi:hypothetical protein
MDKNPEDHLITLSKVFEKFRGKFKMQARKSKFVTK